MRVCWLYCIHTVLWYLYRFLFKRSGIRNIRIAYIFWYIIDALTRLPSFLFCLFVRNLFLDGCDELKSGELLAFFFIFFLFSIQIQYFLSCDTVHALHLLRTDCCSPMGKSMLLPMGSWWKWNEILMIAAIITCCPCYLLSFGRLPGYLRCCSRSLTFMAQQELTLFTIWFAW